MQRCFWKKVYVKEAQEVSKRLKYWQVYDDWWNGQPKLGASLKTQAQLAKTTF